MVKCSNFKFITFILNLFGWFFLFSLIAVQLDTVWSIFLLLFMHFNMIAVIDLFCDMIREDDNSKDTKESGETE